MYLPVLMTEMKMHQTRIWSQSGSLSKKAYSQIPKIVKGIHNKIQHFPFFLCFQIVLFSLLSNNTEFQYTVFDKWMYPSYLPLLYFVHDTWMFEKFFPCKVNQKLCTANTIHESVGLYFYWELFHYDTRFVFIACLKVQGHMLFMV